MTTVRYGTVPHLAYRPLAVQPPGVTLATDVCATAVPKVDGCSKKALIRVRFRRCRINKGTILSYLRTVRDSFFLSR